jgi:hypothetical protein
MLMVVVALISSRAEGVVRKHPMVVPGSNVRRRAASHAMRVGCGALTDVGCGRMTNTQKTVAAMVMTDLL